jgi:hypothetical protein
MKRRTLDLIVTAIGATTTVALMVAGGMLVWGYRFTNADVHNQLAAQQIYFPTAAQLARAKPGTEITPGMRPYLERYAGQQLTTGPQAEAYADHFIAVHLSEMPDGGVYAEVSAASRADPTDATLASLVQVSFQGTTLRGLLLEAYAFSVFGEIARAAAICSFGLAVVVALLTVLGFLHYRRTPEDAPFPRAPADNTEQAGTAV